MFITPLLITAACQNVDAYQNHQDACNKFFEQSAKATQVYQTDDKFENYVTSKAQNEADDYFGQNMEKVGGSTYYVYKVYKNKALDFRLPTLGLADSASNHITPNSYSLNLSWKFPWLK